MTDQADALDPIPIREPVTEAESSDPPPVTARWQLCGASVPGASHFEKGHHSDDAFAYAVVGDVVVVAVADGAGSVTQTSAWGSFSATQQVVSDATAPWFSESLNGVRRGDRSAEDLLRYLFQRAHESLATLAQQHDQPLAELSTTLAVAIVTPEIAMFAQIGDGVIAIRTRHQIQTILMEKKSEYANSTWFLQTTGSFERSFRTWTGANVDAFSLSTDGLAYKITDIPTGAAFEPFYVAAWSSIPDELDEQALADWLGSIENDQTGDDKTIVFARLTSAAGADTAESEVRNCSAPPSNARRE